MDDGGEGFLFGYFFGRYHERRQRARGRRRRPVTTGIARPTMPRRRWIALAMACVVFGVALGAAVFGAADASLPRGAVIGGLAGLVIGMLVAETLWERRQR